MKPFHSCLLAIALAASETLGDQPPKNSTTDISATLSRSGLTSAQISRLRNGIGLRPQQTNPSNGATAPSGLMTNRDAINQSKGPCRRGDSRQPQTSFVVLYNTPVWVDPTAYDQEVQDYYQPGYEWGAGLRENTLKWDGFIPYLKEYLAAASTMGQDAFRSGFVAGFRGNAEAIFDRAARQAYQ